MAIAEQAEDEDSSSGVGVPEVPAGDFARDTRVVPDGEVPGRFLGEIPEAWRVIYAFGGVSMAVAVRAAQAAVDRPDLSLLSANALFCSPVRCEPVEVDTAVLRDGRSAAQATADLRNAGDDGVALHVAATFGHLHETDIEFVDAAFPDVPPPEDCPAPPERSDDDPFPTVNFHQQTDFRPASLVDPWDPDSWEPGHAAEFSSWNRLLVEPRLADGTLDPVALCVPGDMLGPAVGMKRGPAGPEFGVEPFFVLTLEIGLQVCRPWETSWILQHTRAPWAGDGYGLSVLELWDEQGRLVAHATQRARLRTFDPDEGFFSRGG
jgi:acyl-CoA thioesterase